ncbi:3-oxoacyl-[acyl-carrier-protein] synthase III C-terminal domain-containing protein [Conexibacter woesei]|uniref:DUF35 domain-containing protein n=1 Tax=Conexibacter woesei (strain DSM 14684 / CCUG 47730 / CIP 108061 / JCM 11494 / NBRC 100937 / ID131577) TaxID=469383 RepID=D3F4A9_CONWI|nr:3-oxoacyl-[acyl-carrier-protein] synthase III C-terminal domain-containing protein [Conexibacter woesei]ADB50481.1 protein of unknown function DUF35 [Conexibacter woesei DSM 14684]
MAGILAYGAYLPQHRLDRRAIAETLGDGRGRGTRAVAGGDEDTTTLGVDAARIALDGAPADAPPSALYFATTAPAYVDKTNATMIHAALALAPGVSAVDVGGAVRSGAGALRIGLRAAEPALVVLADVRGGLPGSADERDGGDGAAAFLLTGGDGPVVAEYLGGAAATDEFLDRWRVPGRAASRRWGEQFGADIYRRLGLEALTDALIDAGVTLQDVDRLIVTGTNERAVTSLQRASGVPPEAIADDLMDTVGNTGTAHAGVLLAAALDEAAAGETIALVVLSDGAEAFVWRTTEELPLRRAARSVAAQAAAGRDGLPYGRFLAWRERLVTEPPRRLPPPPPVAPASYRDRAWKLRGQGSRCSECDTLHVPPQRVCRHCRAVDELSFERVVDRHGTVVNSTVDRLAWSPSPPAVFAVVDFDGGGRVECEMTDAAPETVVPGLRVGMSFRLMGTLDDIHNYLWKARPLAEVEEDH